MVSFVTLSVTLILHVKFLIVNIVNRTTGKKIMKKNNNRFVLKSESQLQYTPQAMIDDINANVDKALDYYRVYDFTNAFKHIALVITSANQFLNA